MTKQNWQQIYAAGEQLNRYPYDFIVSNYFRHRPTAADSSVRVLDLGCGAGNHSLFCAENGADVLALDYSTAALEVLQRRASEAGLDQHIVSRQADFENFDLDEEGFDIAIDRLAVSHVSRLHATRVYEHIFDALSDGGILLSNLFTTSHSHKDYGDYDSDADIWCNFCGGIFESLKAAYFYTEADARQLLDRFTLISLVRRTENDLVSGDQREIWEIIAQKTGDT